MIRVFFCAAAAVFLFGNAAEARYNPPSGDYITRSSVITSRTFDNLNETNDGKMTLEQYMSREQTRNDRRNIRQDQKNGVYQSAEQRFKAMDTDNDGYVSREEMETYIRGLREQERSFY